MCILKLMLLNEKNTFVLTCVYISLLKKVIYFFYDNVYTTHENKILNKKTCKSTKNSTSITDFVYNKGCTTYKYLEII